MTTTSKAALVLSLLGAALMARGMALEGNMVWLVSNPLWTWYSWHIKAYDMLMLSIAYFLIALYGVIHLW